MYNLLKYLDQYNLCSKKYLEYFYLRKTYLLIQQNKHLTLDGRNLILSYKNRISHLK